MTFYSDSINDLPLLEEVEFPKAVGIAAATYTQLLNGRHGGKIEQTGGEKLTNKQLFAGAEFR